MARDPLDKVRKLLALARSGDVNEAAAAAARAQALIAKYRLEGLVEAEAAQRADPVGEEVIEASKRLRRWRTVLAAALADVNGCSAYTIQDGRVRRIVLAGAASDRAAVRSLWDWLVPRLEWLSATHGGDRDKRWHDDFRVGAVETIAARLREAAVEQRAEVVGSALIRLEPALVARQAALEAHLGERNVGPGRSIRVGVDAWRAGVDAGETVSLGGTSTTRE